MNFSHGMEDLVSYGNRDRDIEQALIALKKGSQLIKYSRKGKPKFRSFRLSPDETAFVWYSHGEERDLKISSVSHIIPGQRTAVFKRYLRPEKDYLSFSVIYNNCEWSLDLICKDNAEIGVWLAGLSALISPGQRNRCTRSDLSDITANSEFDRSRASLDSGSLEDQFNFARSDVGSERDKMQVRNNTGDGFRVSVSSTPSCSSGGSGQDDIESLGDVYIWGEVWTDGGAVDASGNPIPLKTDIVAPKCLESNIVLDVHQIASGARHIALVTRQGEVFTWGEESGGRLGHGIDKDFSRPRLVEFLALSNVDFVACGEQHTCATSTSGDLFIWGDGTHNAGLLGLGTNISHWIPKIVNGPLEGLQVLSVACGAWHSALATSNGKLFTFGDGTFGVLGHGNRSSVSYPKEVSSLIGLKALKVACGVWHTAAIVEVMGQPGGNTSSKKLFTWGDGDKYRLGHGDKESHLQPTCVSSLIEYNFHQLACGHNMTVGLVTSGHVFTMGSNTHGQLGNPSADGKAPCLVQDKLVGEFVQEISCGAYHVAVLTSRSEVYTWGLGDNGRLGHGDLKNRKTPTLVEALRDRHVKSISCGSTFTTCICIHKWVSGADQSICTGCRQAFGFTRKRHNCYNCGLVHCHACSSKKALKVALAPTPSKPHRVCDACYAKLKANESAVKASVSRKATSHCQSTNGGERMDREVRSTRLLLPPATESVNFFDMKSGRHELRFESPSRGRGSVQSLQQLKDTPVPNSLTAAFKPAPSTPQSSVPSPPHPRPASPFSRRPSPQRSGAPVFSRGLMDSLRKSNDLLNQEVSKLQNQMRNLKQKSYMQDMEIQKLQKIVKEATSLAGEKSSKFNSARELIKSLTIQLKEVSEQMPQEVNESLTNMHSESEAFLCSNFESHVNSSSMTATSGSDLKNAYDETSINNYSRQNERRAIDCTENNSRLSEYGSKEEEKQVIEQFEPGVYVTLTVLPNGNKAFKRVRFSKRRFDGKQAEDWWNKNKERVLKKYNSSIPSIAPIGSSADSGLPPLPEKNMESSSPS